MLGQGHAQLAAELQAWSQHPQASKHAASFLDDLADVLSFMCLMERRACGAGDLFPVLPPCGSSEQEAVSSAGLPRSDSDRASVGLGGISSISAAAGAMHTTVAAIPAGVQSLSGAEAAPAMPAAPATPDGALPGIAWPPPSEGVAVLLREAHQPKVLSMMAEVSGTAARDVRAPCAQHDGRCERAAGGADWLEVLVWACEDPAAAVSGQRLHQDLCVL